jgi:EmrB/QacA subfamily drug resistance transporter
MSDHHGHELTDRPGPHPGEHEPQSGPPQPLRWWALGVLSLGLLIIMIGNSVVTVALPNMVRELGASNSELQWIVNAYILVFGGLLLTGGAIGDRYGRKGALLTGFVVFVGGSLFAAFASSAGGVIGARAVMGVGAALIMPGTLSLLPTIFTDKRERARAIGIWTGLAWLGAAIGPTVGGWLVDHYRWPAVFWINVPLIAIAAVAGLFLLPRSRAEKPPQLDPLGTVLSTAGLALILWAVIGAPTRGWDTPMTVVALCLGAALLVAFAMWELRTDSPMLDLRVFRDPTLSVAIMAIGVGFLALGAAVFFMTQYLQFIFGYSAFKAGLGIVPFALAVSAGAPLSTPLSRRLGTASVIAGGLALVSVGLAVLAFWTSADSYLPAGVGLVLCGLGIGFSAPSAVRVMVATLPPAKAGVASAITDLTHEVATAIGIAVLGTVLATSYRSQMASSVGGLGLSDADVAKIGDHVGDALKVAATLPPGHADGLVAAARDACISSMQLGLTISAATAVLAVVAALRLRRHVATDPKSGGQQTPATTEV